MLMGVKGIGFGVFIQTQVELKWAFQWESWSLKCGVPGIEKTSCGSASV